MSYSTFKLEFLNQATIAKLTLSRPKAMNAMNPKFFEELEQIFDSFQKHQTIRVVILVADGKVFTAGLDLKELGSMFVFDFAENDPARESIKLYNTILKLQGIFLKVYECKVPVLVGVHNKCIGGGIDLASMCDIRYCTQDAEFTIKEIDIGMAADLGTLQFMEQAVGSQSTFRELAYTGRFLKAEEAKQIGFVTKVCESKESLEKQLMLTAQAIASKGPVGIHALKQIMKRQFRKKVEESLEYTARVNSSLLFTKDMSEAITSFFQKKKPAFSKL